MRSNESLKVKRMLCYEHKRKVVGINLNNTSLEKSLNCFVCIKESKKDPSDFIEVQDFLELLMQKRQNLITISHSLNKLFKMLQEQLFITINEIPMKILDYDELQAAVDRYKASFTNLSNSFENLKLFLSQNADQEIQKKEVENKKEIEKTQKLTRSTFQTFNSDQQNINENQLLLQQKRTFQPTFHQRWKSQLPSQLPSKLNKTEIDLSTPQARSKIVSSKEPTKNICSFQRNYSINQLTQINAPREWRSPLQSQTKRFCQVKSFHNQYTPQQPDRKCSPFSFSTQIKTLDDISEKALGQRHSIIRTPNKVKRRRASDIIYFQNK